MTKLLFLILGELSAGELTIADSFQAGLPKTRYESYFIVPEHQKGYVKSRNIPYLSLGLNDGKVINRKGGHQWRWTTFYLRITFYLYK